MKGLFLSCLVAAMLLSSSGSVFAEETLQIGSFGTVTLYRQSIHPSQVVLFVSGDGGWNLGVVDMAKELSSLDALVVGIDITHYLKELAASHERCSYPAGDLEELSQFVQRKVRMQAYIPPLLVGYSSGATLVYAALVQAPEGTFRGAISMGFCPVLPLAKPFCRGNGLEWTRALKGKGFRFLPARRLDSPWVAFQGTIDQVCNAENVQAFVKQVSGGEIVLLHRVGHGFSVPRNWMPQFRETFRRLTGKSNPVPRPEATEVADLPLVEVRAKGMEKNKLVVMITGDGGWAGIDREIGNMLAADGFPVVGLNSLQYFWRGRSIEGAARDLERILRHYLSAWGKKTAVLIGYSRGADVLPFMISRLPAELSSRIQFVVLLAPAEETEFEIHLRDLFGGSAGSSALPVLPEVLKMKGMKILCFYGSEEKSSLCRRLEPAEAQVIELQGGHHFGGDYKGIAERILKELQ